ncbi:MAG: hypothetical protein DHS20C10_06520 [marine bacterium B5-7]|nr:MAG: hypothetical protein DHS20C10_06520 [marine bacterium B5-7]
MEIKLKQRLVGGIVLLGLLMMLAPLFLHHGAKTPKPQSLATLLPQHMPEEKAAQQTIDFKPVTQPVKPVAEKASEVPQQAVSPAATPEPIPMFINRQAAHEQQVQQAQAAQAAAFLAGASESVPPAVIEKPSPVTKKPKHVAKKISPVKKTKKVVSVKPAADTTQWFVQLGSFQEFHRAEVLRLKLFHAQFPAMIRANKTAKGMFYRVLLGPTPNRSTATLLMRQAKHERGIKGFVTHLPK